MSQYDIVLTSDSTDYSYMLRQRNDTKDWLISDSPLLPQTLITESASPSHIQPEREIQISQVDWRKGVQDLLLEDARKYFDATNCDGRFKGQVILSPKKLTAIAAGGAPPAAVLADANLEDWASSTDLTHWVETGTGVDRNTLSSYKHSGDYSAVKQSSNSASPQTGSIYRDIAFDNAYRDRNFTFKAWGLVQKRHSYALSWIKVRIDDGVGASTSDTYTGQEWYQLSVSRKLDSAATRLRVEVFYQVVRLSYEDLNRIAIDDLSLQYPIGSSISKIVEFGDKLVGTQGTELIDVSDGSVIKSCSETITDLCVFENRLYIALGWDDPYYYTSDLVTFTQSTLSNATAKYMANIGNAQFWIADSENTMRDSDNPINGGTAFSSAYTVGSDEWEITGLVNHSDVVFVRKEDNIYYLSEADVLELIPELSSEASVTNTYGLYLWKGCLYIPSGENSLYEYDIASGTVTTISPVRYAPGDSNFDGKVLCIGYDETYLYVVLDNEPELKVLAGRWEYVAGETNWFWHPVYQFGSSTVNTAIISSLTGDKRLYLGTDSDGIVPFIVPYSYSGVLQEDGYKVIGSGEFITSWFASNFPTDMKYWKSIGVTSKCIEDKTQILVYYQVKGGEWTYLASCTQSELKDGGYPDEVTDDFDIGASSERIRFKFTLQASDDDFSPVLYGDGGGFVVYANLLPERKRQITATIDLAPEIRLRDNTIEERVVSTDLTNLRALYAGNEAVTVTGPDGTEYTCVFARDGYDEQLAYEESTHRIEHWWCTLRLLEA